MSNDIPTLQDRRYFPAWQKAIRKHLTPSQWKTVTWPDGGPPSNRSDCLIWEKVRAQAYNTIIQSIPDVILLGLGAHDELTSLRDFYHADHEGYTVSCVPGGCPRDLYNVICKWFNPTRAIIAAQIRCIANTDPAKFEDAERYMARMWLSKTSLIQRWWRHWWRWTILGHFLRCCAHYRPKDSHGSRLCAPRRGSGWQTTHREKRRGSRRNLRRRLLMSR
ncbi:hypothetical protein CCHR01_17128 [Colletotrichum chrysophilum]|uniref:Uncharacterized protein n=1 Tax=Colletotrichum chrysophilum TaxID=1836956 RepID=A0AAD9A2X1_9PEZI|nr:hypothetical protein CCHR01_17128 [Colletotrichum chrysophilum]